jgi:ribosomal protein L11 methyltransferase
MFEYRLTTMPLALKRELKKLKIDLVQESFRRRRSWLLYSRKDISPLLKLHSVEFTKERIEDTGWDTRWRNFLEDGWLTDKVYYCFEPKKFDDGRHVIEINPALAFGTGGHATTQIAARLLEPIAKGQEVLDVGTGSGILAILASMMGAKRVFACDIDAVAIKNAKENIAINKCSNIFLWAGGVDSVNTDFRSGIVVANIISSVLAKIHPHIITLHPKYIIYSGILQREGGEFFSTIKTHGYEPEAVLHIGEWSGIRLKRTI